MQSRRNQRGHTHLVADALALLLRSEIGFLGGELPTAIAPSKRSPVPSTSEGLASLWGRKATCTAALEAVAVHTVGGEPPLIKERLLGPCWEPEALHRGRRKSAAREAARNNLRIEPLSLDGARANLYQSVRPIASPKAVPSTHEATAAPSTAAPSEPSSWVKPVSSSASFPNARKAVALQTSV